MHPPELERERDRAPFDPIAEGARYKLSRELSLALWARVCADATDGDDRRDAAQAEQRFRDLAARLAARGGRWQPDVGRLTRVGTELGDQPVDARYARELAHRVPGRDTLVAAEERLAAQLRRTFGTSAGDVAITPDSSRPLTAAAEAVAVGEQVYIAPGYYDLTTTEGRERLGHEVAHVLQQRRGRDLPAQITPGERAGLEAEADLAGQAFARGQRFAVQGRAPSLAALFKGGKSTGTTPTGAGATPTTTTIDLKSGGRIERKAPAAPAGGDPAAAPATGGKAPPKAKEQLVVTYGAVQASNPFTIERDDSGEAKKLVGKAKLTLPASKYLKPLELDIALGADGYLGAKLTKSATTTVQIGGLVVQGGQLTAAIDRGQLAYSLDGANLALPSNIGDGSLTIQGSGDQPPAFDAQLSINVPKMQPATMSFHADDSGYRAEGSTGVDIKMASGTVTFGLEKVGDDKALWSAAGSVGYNSERLSGQISVQYNANGELSGEGNLQFQIADFLTGSANVAVDKDGHVTVNGEISPPNETQLFPEKKIENTFFHKSLEFPIWGISIPAVGSVGIIAFIEGSLGYRVGVGAGVMRNIVLSGKYSTDPKVEPTFGITGEIFIPAFAELLISVGGGIKLDAFIAEVGGGVKVDGRAGFYGGLSVKPSLAYEGGKYKLTGQAILAGDVGLSAQVDAFVRLHVGKWMFSWEKEWDWKLAEWNKWLGLNLGMEADLDYTLGQPLSPDIFKLKKPDSIDVQDIAKSAMPQGGMPPQGPKGAQHEHEEFKQKGGGGPGAPSAPSEKPKVAGTPAGAAGHKNQDPKGKEVKPGKPAKPGKPKKAKGKGPNETGPNPKSKAKPSEQKTDAKPIIEQFSMHGEPHQLIVQLGPGGHVDMASKRERLSVKVGHAVGVLTAKHASPQQIADLKEIGATAKRGDKMVATAKLTDKPGTAQVAQQIKKYGDKWQVKDLDEVAIVAPRALTVTHPVHLEKLSDALNKALGTAHTGQVIASKPGDPKEATKQLLEKHKDAKFDFPSAHLTLPALKPAPLQAAHSADQLGQLLAQQTGVTKVTLKQTEQKGALKFELIGSIGSASATLGTAVVDAVPHSLAVPHPIHLDKLSEPLSKALGTIHSAQVIFHKSGDPRQATRQLLQSHTDARFDFATAKLTLPALHPAPLQSAGAIDQLGQLLSQQTGVLKVTIKQTAHEGQTKLEFHAELGTATATLGTATVTATADEVPKSLSIPGHAKLDKQPPSLAKEIAKAASGTAIWTAPVTDPKQVTTNLLHAHKDAHFDHTSKNLQLPAVHPAALSAATSLAQLGHLVGQQLGVSKITLNKTAEGHFTLVASINPQITALDGTTETVDKIAVAPFDFRPTDYTPSLIENIESTPTTKFETSKLPDEALLSEARKNGHLDETTATLHLPAVVLGDVKTKERVHTMVNAVGERTHARKTTFQKHESDAKFTLEVGFEDPTLGSGTAVTGALVKTFEQRVKEFAASWPMKPAPEDQYLRQDEVDAEGKLIAGTTPKIKKATEPFVNANYVACFASDKSQLVDTDKAGSDLKRWYDQAVPGCGQLSRVGGIAARTYILVDAYDQVIIDSHSKVVDLTMQDAVKAAGDIITFLKLIAQHADPPHGITYEQLNVLWSHEPNRSWLSEQLRGFKQDSGHHEWVPCQTIPVIVLKTINQRLNPTDWAAEALTWIDLQHELRIPTRELIGKPPERWVYEDGVDVSGWVPQGHDGAVEFRKKAQTQKGLSGNGSFHTDLVAGVQPCETAADYVLHAKNIFSAYIWDGSAVPEGELHIEAEIKQLDEHPATMAALATAQGNAYKRAIAKFDALEKKFAGMIRR